MHIFWDIVIQPILSLLHPKCVVEVGSERGYTTQKLLEFCVRRSAVLHAIDPAPLFDVASAQGQFPRNFVFHEATSLKALPQIHGYDAVLLDGDHNWYTVYHELKTIEAESRQANQPFPFVFLHDVGWPYGRRDLYYSPETIPAEFRQPYARKGMRVGSTELVDQGGVNANLCNALTANTPRNGVLTAVEDFLRQAGLPLQWLIVPGFHGLGMVFPSEVYRDHLVLGQFLKSWDLSPAVRRLMDQIEVGRLQLSATVANQTGRG